MKNLILPIVLPIILFVFCGCEEPDSPLLFSTENITNPENVKIEYYSVDPLHCPKAYHITTNQFSSEITITCINADCIQFESPDGSLSKDFISARLKMTGEVIDSKTLTFRFEEVSDEEEEWEFGFVGHNIGVIGKTKKGLEKTYIDITRLFRNHPI